MALVHDSAYVLRVGEEGSKFENPLDHLEGYLNPITGQYRELSREVFREKGTLYSLRNHT